MRKTLVMLLAVLLVCAGAYYAWYMLFSTSAGGTSVVGEPVAVRSGTVGAASGSTAARVGGSDAISDEVARSTFKTFALAMARDDPATACGFSAYRGSAVGMANHLDDCRAEVVEEVSSLSDSELGALRDALRSGTYVVTGRPSSGGVSVSATVLGQTLSGTVVDADGRALVELTTLSRR